MNPDLMNWAQSEQAQPYLQQVMPQQQMQPQQMGMQQPSNGYSAAGGDYNTLLRSLFDANAGNPELQKSILSIYLSGIDPQAQFEQQQKEQAMLDDQKQMEQSRDMTILQALDPADPSSGAIVDAILSKYGYGSAAQPQDNGYTSNWQTQYGDLADSAQGLDEYNRYATMQAFTPQQISAYEAPISLGERWNAYSDNFTPGLAFSGLGALLNGENIRGQRVGLN